MFGILLSVAERFYRSCWSNILIVVVYTAPHIREYAIKIGWEALETFYMGTSYMNSKLTALSDIFFKSLNIFSSYVQPKTTLLQYKSIVFGWTYEVSIIVDLLDPNQKLYFL